MVDLVATLRDCANGMGDFKNDRGDFGLCDDAADEIERLRMALRNVARDLHEIAAGDMSAYEALDGISAFTAIIEKEAGE